MNIYAGINLEGPDYWDLSDEWIEIDIDVKLCKALPILHSSNYTGFLSQVSKEIVGKPLGMNLCLTTGHLIHEEISTLLGCFIGKEMCPRFLATFDSAGGLTLYTKHHIYFNHRLDQEPSDEYFDPTLENLKTQLWKV